MIKIGQTKTVSSEVTDNDTAKSLLIGFGETLPTDNYADVFATTKMIGLMELAAGRLLYAIQNSNQLSVGVDVSIKHLNATPVGQQVTATATFIGQEGLLYKFKVDAFDNGGKIGEGFHTRAIIEIDRLVSGAERRILNNK
ncbi:thioesterase family protein [Flavobacterium luteum]|uniref:Thioesterase n=1 Tax=Flavobacterium luteum TaxID=2026654 RepID=A0A7J5AJK2_9FLAO|nr:hotdog domain-containing protein [Flavobacterium luteum]KAB1157787.1 thioesterase [Flavobacterium luteum]